MVRLQALWISLDPLTFFCFMYFVEDESVLIEAMVNGLL